MDDILENAAVATHLGKLRDHVNECDRCRSVLRAKRMPDTLDGAHTEFKNLMEGPELCDVGRPLMKAMVDATAVQLDLTLSLPLFGKRKIADA